MISVYLKPTNRCPVGCSHCYLSEEIRKSKEIMSFDILKNVCTFLEEMKLKSRSKDVLILWHGGEPLTLSAKWYEEAKNVMDSHLNNYVESIQTSLIPLREEHIDLIKNRFNSFVGSSIDFSQRKISNSVDKYHELWLKKVDMARSHNIEIVPGVVPTKQELGKEKYIVDWMKKYNFNVFNVERYNTYGISVNDSPTNLEQSYFWIGLFNAVMDEMKLNNKAPIIRVILASIRGILFGVSGDRWGGSCQSDFVVIEPNGSLNTCPDKSSFEESHGNVSEGYVNFAASAFRKKWIKHQNLFHKKTYCQSCENAVFCKSGCPIVPNGIEDGEVECSGYKTYLDYVRNFIETPINKELVLSYLKYNNDYYDNNIVSSY